MATGEDDEDSAGCDGLAEATRVLLEALLLRALDVLADAFRWAENAAYGASARDASRHSSRHPPASQRLVLCALFTMRLLSRAALLFNRYNSGKIFNTWID